MLITFAHAGHSHDIETVNGLDHCTPIIIGAGIIIALLLGIIAYLLASRPAKSPTVKKSGAKSAKK